MESLLTSVKNTVRGIMYEVAKLLDLMTNRRIRPNHITIVSFLGHIILLLALVEGRFAESALLLVFFGLLDSVDGQLAKLQNTASTTGMLIDSTSDRLKEMLIYGGLAIWFSEQGQTIGVLYSVLALGVSFGVSYVKAKGEVALLEKSHGKSPKGGINRVFGTGIFSYEVRMFILVIGFLAEEPLYAVAFVLAGSLLTLIDRFANITKKLR